MTRPDRDQYPVARGVSPPPATRRAGWPRAVVLAPLPCVFLGWFIFQGPGADWIRRLNYRPTELATPDSPAPRPEPVASVPPEPRRAEALAAIVPPRGTESGYAARQDVSFAEISELFAAKCNHCHAGDRPKGGLDLRSHAAILRGGNSGPSVIAGKSAESVLWDSVNSGSMPPGKSKALTPREKQLIRDWIDGGAR